MFAKTYQTDFIFVKILDGGFGGRQRPHFVELQRNSKPKLIQTARTQGPKCCFGTNHRSFAT
jgi:hypothetical protein